MCIHCKLRRTKASREARKEIIMICLRRLFYSRDIRRLIYSQCNNVFLDETLLITIPYSNSSPYHPETRTIRLSEDVHERWLIRHTGQIM